MEIEINGVTYAFQASMEFIEAIDKTDVKDVQGMEVPFGLLSTYTMMTEFADPVALRTMLYYLNIGQTPRVSMKTLNGYLETADIEELIEKVADFLYSKKLSGMKLSKLLGKRDQKPKA